MIIEGPATVQLESPLAARLVTGRATAKVPSQAIGFTIHSQVADFVDLGTEFTVKLDPRARRCELFVFDGLVEMQLVGRYGDDLKKALRISEGRAVRFDADLRSVDTLDYDPKQRLAL